MDQPSRGHMYEAFGAYVRSQRQLAQLTLRQAAELARISNPYLSQIEHGMALPSVTVISAMADALQVSADALLLRAAGLATGHATQPSAATEDAIRHDARLTDPQKHALHGAPVNRCVTGKRRRYPSLSLPMANSKATSLMRRCFIGVRAATVRERPSGNEQWSLPNGRGSDNPHFTIVAT